MVLDIKVCSNPKHETHIAVWDRESEETICMIPLGDEFDIPKSRDKARWIIEALTTGENDMNSISPMGIMKIGDVMQKAAMEQTAKDAGVSLEELPALMKSDASVAKRFRDYIVSGFNLATSKL